MPAPNRQKAKPNEAKRQGCAGIRPPRGVSARALPWAQMNLAVALFGLSAIIAASLKASAAMMVFGRALFAFLAISLVFLIRARRPWRAAAPAMIFRLGPIGLTLAAHWVAFFVAVQKGGVALATLGFASFPAFVTILESLLYKEKPTLPELGVIALVSAGLVLVTPSLDPGEMRVAGLLWGVFSGLLYAGIIVANRRLTSGVDGFTSCWWQYLSVSLVLLPFVAREIPGVSLHGWSMLLLLGLVCTALAFTLFIFGLKQVKSGEAAVISAMEPVYAIIMAWAILGDIPTLRMVGGGFLILGAVVWSGLGSTRK